MPESLEETELSFDEMYSRRRIVETGKPFEVPIVDFGVSSEGDLCVKIDVVEDEYFVIFSDVSDGYDDLSGSGGVLSFLSECGTFDGSVESVVSEEVSLKFNEEFTRCDFPDSDSYRFVLSDSVEGFEQVDSIEGLSQDKLLFYLSYFRDGDGEKAGLKSRVTDVLEGESEEQFRVEVDNGAVWGFEVPKTTDPEGSDVARLIETVGQGQISFLESEYVYVVHESDEDLNLDSCGLDESGMWYLVTPEDWKSWDEYEEPSYSDSNSDVSVSNRRPSSSSDSSSSDDVELDFVSVRTGVMLIIQGFLFVFLYDLLMSPVVAGMGEGMGGGESAAFVQTVDTLMGTIPLMLGFFGMIIIVMSQIVDRTDVG